MMVCGRASKPAPLHAAPCPLPATRPRALGGTLVAAAFGPAYLPPPPASSGGRGGGRALLPLARGTPARGGLLERQRWTSQGSMVGSRGGLTSAEPDYSTGS